MKKILVIFFLIPTFIYSQEFKVDCGNDTVFCKLMHFNKIYLGTQVKLHNGTPPFTYKWSCNYNMLNLINFTAETFLNDTFSKNPYFKDFPLGKDSIIFILTVIDSNGILKKDSIKVQFSQFIYSLEYYEFKINSGDSVHLSDVIIGGGFAPLKYNWIPNEGLSDYNSNNPWAKPKNSIKYYQYATDSEGCKSDTLMVYNITVNSTSIKELNNVINSRQVNNRILFDNPFGQMAFIKVYSLGGKMLLLEKTNETFFEINHLNFPKGIYLYTLQIKNNYESKRLVKF